MKSMKILYVPVAACVLYSFDGFNRNSPLKYPVVQAAEQQMKLEQVQIVFRHGARTPNLKWIKETFHNFTNIEAQTWDKNRLLCGMMSPEFDVKVDVKLANGNPPSTPPVDEMSIYKEIKGGCFNGQLTVVGQKQLYNLGKFISEKYIDTGFISPSYNKDEVYIRTSYYRRTIQSVTSLLAGLYGKDNLTEPVPIETKEIKDEDIYANTHACEKFNAWFYHVLSRESSPLDEIETENFLNNLMGKKENERNASMTSINDLIRCRETHGLDIPQYLLDNRELISKYEIKLMEDIFGKGSLDILRSNVGSFVETICCRINEAIDGSRQTKMFLYSAHDWTIFSLLIAFGVEVKEFPKFGCSLIMELYKREDGKRFVKVLLNNEPVILDRENNEEYLPVEKFFDLVEACRVLDFHKSCEIVPQKHVPA